jgi:hypothetical protein
MSDNKYLAAAKEHFKALGSPHIDVPEWQIDGKPIRIFWKPLTIVERDEIHAGDGTDLEIFVKKALDEKGERMFTIEDKQHIKRLVAPQIISRVAVRMMQLPTIEETEKN